MRAIEWRATRVRFIDQTRLPDVEEYIETDDYRVVGDAIRALKIRGAPAIGVAAAYGVALAALSCRCSSADELRRCVRQAADELASTRPTAVNLFWALDQMIRTAGEPGSPGEIRARLAARAVEVHRADEEMCTRIGMHGAELLKNASTVLTHCNTGALATGGDGTALNVIATAHRRMRPLTVFATETRPLLQGARLTIWELKKLGIPATLITDSTALFLMQQGRVDAVVVGADRIAANGDTANKVGTYMLAVGAVHHRIPFYIAAPTSTIDPAASSGSSIPIEERGAHEVAELFGHRLTPEGTTVYSPAFDITPASLISAIITEEGVRTPPYSLRDSGHKSGR